MKATGHKASARLKMTGGPEGRTESSVDGKSAIPGGWIDKGKKGSETRTISQLVLLQWVKGGCSIYFRTVFSWTEEPVQYRSEIKYPEKIEKIEA